MTAGRLHPEVLVHLDECARAGIRDISTLSVEDARRAAREALSLASRPVPVLVPPSDLVMRAHGRDIAARVYRPDVPDPAETGAPVLVWFHGGGFVVGDLDSTDAICGDLATQAGITVVSVDYRKAPQHRWPAAHEDAYDAVLWVLHHGADIGVDPHRVAVGGDSAGGHLAAATARRVASELGALLRLQVLFYPVISDRIDSPSYRDFATGFGLDADAMRWFLGHLDVREGRSAWPFDLMATPPPPGLAPAHVVTAECDVLRDGAEEYLTALVEAGVAGSGVRYLGMPHGFAQMSAVTPQAAASIAGAAHALRAALAARGASAARVRQPR